MTAIAAFTSCSHPAHCATRRGERPARIRRHPRPQLAVDRAARLDRRALLVDLLVFHKEAHEINTREAATSRPWISIGLAFIVVIWWWFNGACGRLLLRLSIEKSLSIDNVFVWALLMSYRGPAEVSAPGVVLGHLRCPGDAGDLHLRRHRDHRALRGCSTSSGVPALHRSRWCAGRRPPGRSVQQQFLKLVNRIVPSTNSSTARSCSPRSTAAPRHPAVRGVDPVEATDVIFAVDSVPWCWR